MYCPLNKREYITSLVSINAITTDVKKGGGVPTAASLALLMRNVKKGGDTKISEWQLRFISVAHIKREQMILAVYLVE
jgi:hypothetical protein